MIKKKHPDYLLPLLSPGESVYLDCVYDGIYQIREGLIQSVGRVRGGNVVHVYQIQSGDHFFERETGQLPFARGLLIKTTAKKVVYLRGLLGRFVEDEVINKASDELDRLLIELRVLRNYAHEVVTLPQKFWHY